METLTEKMPEIRNPVLANGTYFKDLTPEQIQKIRHIFRHDLGLIEDLVDVEDRLTLLIALDFHMRNMKGWMKTAEKLRKRVAELEDRVGNVFPINK